MDQGGSAAADRDLHLKNWLIAEPTGTVMLTTSEGVRGGLHVLGCGIVVLDVNGPDMERALTADSRLGTPVDRSGPAAGGGTSVSWQARFSSAAATDDNRVTLSYGLPGQSGVIVNLIYRQKIVAYKATPARRRRHRKT